jgi:hypothetical protein
MRIMGEIPVLVNGQRVATAREVSWGGSWEARPAPEEKWWLPEPEAPRVENRHDRRRAAALARRRADG